MHKGVLLLLILMISGPNSAKLDKKYRKAEYRTAVNSKYSPHPPLREAIQIGNMPKIWKKSLRGGGVSAQNQKVHNSGFSGFSQIKLTEIYGPDFDDILVRYRQHLVHIWLLYD